MQSALKIRVLLLSSVVLLAVTASAQDANSNSSLSAEQIMENLQAMNAKRAERLRAYTGIRVYESSYSGIFGQKHARMEVRVTYADKKKEFTVVSEMGSRLIRNRVFRKLLKAEKEASTPGTREEVALTQRNYRFQLLPADQPGLFRIAVTPKRKGKFLFDGIVWIDSTDFALTRVEAHPAKNPSLWLTGTNILIEYGKVKEFWLPITNRSHSNVRLGGNADLHIEYRDYNVSRDEHDEGDEVIPPAVGSLRTNS